MKLNSGIQAYLTFTAGQLIGTVIGYFASTDHVVAISVASLVAANVLLQILAVLVGLLVDYIQTTG